MSKITRWIGNFFNPKGMEGIDVGRRQILTAGVVGIGGGLLFKGQPLSGGRTSTMVPPMNRSVRSTKYVGLVKSFVST